MVPPHMQTGSISRLSIKDLLALVSVTAGFKPIAAFGFLSENNEGEIRNLRDRVVDLGLKTQITTFIQKPSARHLDDFPAEVVRAFQIFDREKDQGRRDYLLWVARESSAVSAVKLAVERERRPREEKKSNTLTFSAAILGAAIQALTPRGFSH